MTEAAMEATDLPRPVSSSSYSGIRFIGAALAPTFTGPLSHLGGMGMPYLVGAATTVVALVALGVERYVVGRRLVPAVADGRGVTATADPVGR